MAGIIGWVGLIVPHLVRMMVGPDNRRVVPLSAALGAAFLMLADDPRQNARLLVRDPGRHLHQPDRDPLLHLPAPEVEAGLVMSILVSGLTFRYKHFTLSVPELEIASARLTAIVGPNGAGKTTLLKCLSGILAVPRGIVTLDGRDIAALTAGERAKRLAYVPQEHASAFNYSVRDFVLMGRAAFVPLFSVPSAEDIRAAEEAIGFIGLGPDAAVPTDSSAAGSAAASSSPGPSPSGPRSSSSTSRPRSSIRATRPSSWR